jgi:hypothetical protein
MSLWKVEELKGRTLQEEQFQTIQSLLESSGTFAVTAAIDLGPARAGCPRGAGASKPRSSGSTVIYFPSE